jgi:hypothetical protein
MSARILARQPGEWTPGYSSGHFLLPGIHPKEYGLNLYERLVKHMRGCIATVSLVLFRSEPLTERSFQEEYGAEQPRREGERMLIILIILLLVFGFGGYRLGPGLGYYGGGGISLIILIVIILLLLRVI